MVLGSTVERENNYCFAIHSFIVQYPIPPVVLLSASYVLDTNLIMEI